MRKAAFKTLGCRLNQYETDALVSEFNDLGYQIVNFNNKADVVVVNTCTVTNQSDHKSRNTISQAVRNNQGSLVVVTGCMVNNYKEKLESEGKVTYVVNKEKASIPQLVDAHFRGEILHPENLSGGLFNFGVINKSLHTRGAIKIQDGCDNFCSFCIIPAVRGRAASRPLPEIIDCVKKTLDNGFKELVITGVNIGRYEWEGKCFEDVLEAILEISADFRLRISSIEPDGFGDRFFDLFQHEKLAPHLHLCLQSGSDKILLRMRRMYDLKQFSGFVSRLRKVNPEFNLTTDMIVGFPGETDDDFKRSLKAIKDFAFSHVHTFKYSVRKGTRAERMTDQIPGNLKNERSELIRKLSEELRRDYLENFINKKQKVLVEKIDNDGFASGYGEHYIPVSFSANNIKRNTFSNVQLIEVRGKAEELKLTGELIPQNTNLYKI